MYVKRLQKVKKNIIVSWVQSHILALLDQQFTLWANCQTLFKQTSEFDNFKLIISKHKYFHDTSKGNFIPIFFKYELSSFKASHNLAHDHEIIYLVNVEI